VQTLLTNVQGPIIAFAVY